MKRQTCKRKSAPKQGKTSPAPLRINTASPACDFSFPVAHLEKEWNRFSQSSLESAEIRTETGKAHFVSYLFHFSFIIFSCLGKNDRRTKHHISFKELPRPDQTTREYYFCYSHERQMGEATNFSSDYADFECFESLGRRPSQPNTSNWVSQLFLWPLYLPFPTPPPKASTMQTSSTPKPPSPEVTLVHMNTWNPAFLWKHWVGQRWTSPAITKWTPGQKPGFDSRLRSHFSSW